MSNRRGDATPYSDSQREVPGDLIIDLLVIYNFFGRSMTPTVREGRNSAVCGIILVDDYCAGGVLERAAAAAAGDPKACLNWGCRPSQGPWRV